MEKEMFKRFEELSEKVTMKIDHIYQEFEELLMEMRDYDDARADVMSEALNELLKLGLVPGAMLRLCNGKTYRFDRYKGNRVVCIGDDGQEIGSDVDTMLNAHGTKWEVMK